MAECMATQWWVKRVSGLGWVHAPGGAPGLKVIVEDVKIKPQIMT